jgi:hypothetical protein
MYDDDSPSQIRLTMWLTLINHKPSNTKSETLIKLLDEYYNWVMGQEGEVVNFTICEGKSDDTV